MSNDQLQSEIEILRAQVAELTAARENEKNNTRTKAQSQADEGKSEYSETESEQLSASVIDKTSADVEGDLEHQLHELVDTINTELKDASPVTVLVVFTVGLLVGRFLPR